MMLQNRQRNIVKRVREAGGMTSRRQKAEGKRIGKKTEIKKMNQEGERTSFIRWRRRDMLCVYNKTIPMKIGLT